MLLTMFLRSCHSVFIKGVSWLCFTFSGVQVSVGIFRSCCFVCQRVSRCQRVVLLYLGILSPSFYIPVRKTGHSMLRGMASVCPSVNVFVSG